MFSSLEDLKNTWSEEEFLRRYEEAPSKRGFIKSLGLKRSEVEHYRKKLLFEPYVELRKCVSCGVDFPHEVKSPKSTTKTCPSCVKTNMRQVNATYIKNRPSHRRKNPKESKTVGELKDAIVDTFFVSFRPDPIDTLFVHLTCVCGSEVKERVKHVLKPPRTRKNSCGCKRSSGTSTQEQQIQKFLTEELNIPQEQIQRNKKPEFMGGYELDFYLPKQNVAIEFHGLAHHSERPVYRDKDLTKVKKTHQEKYLAAGRAGVQLIQIFEDEWNAKTEIIKSMIRARLGLTVTRIHARKTEVRACKPRECKQFFQENHVAGHSNAKQTFALIQNGVIVAALSLRGTWNKAYGNVVEIARFATLKNHSIPGGFTKLLVRVESWARDQGYDAILTYADCRFGSGTVYLCAGFEDRGITRPNYFYEKNGIREDRFKHRKDANLPQPTEREQQNALGWYALYDAGSKIYLKTL